MRQEEVTIQCSGSLPRWLQQPSLAQAETRSQDHCHGLPCNWQGAEKLHRLLPPFHEAGSQAERPLSTSICKQQLNCTVHESDNRIIDQSPLLVPGEEGSSLFLGL